MEVKLRGRDKLLIGCIYRSPNSDEVNNVKLKTNLQTICEEQSFTHLLICGDFNLPEIDWENEISPTNPNCVSYRFMEAIRVCFLTQHVTKATHKRGDQRANILDLVLTNEEGMVDSVSHEAPLGKSHHCTLIFKVNCYADPKPKARKYR